MFRYAQIAQELRERIARGEYATGRLPAERTLGREFGVQRDTIRQALDVLTQQRVLLRDSTRGTFLSPEFTNAGITGSPAAPARALLIVPRFDETLAPAMVLRGLAEQMDSVGIPISWCDSGASASTDSQETALRAAQNTCGTVLWPSLPTSLEELQNLQREIPLVLIDRRVPGLVADFVGFQDRDGGRKITEHLLSLGHRRIGFASGEPQASSVQARLAGYLDALMSAGITPDPSLELHQYGGTSLLTRAKVDAFLMPPSEPLTAVVCSNDVVAAHMIHHVRCQRRQVPEDVAVTGFGDLAPSMTEAFGITTVSQSFKEMGRKAGELLLKRMNGTPAGGTSTEIELPMQIIVRASCGTAP